MHEPRCIRNICFVGAGHVGGPTAAVMAFYNPEIRVNVVDNNKDRIDRWNSKHLPISEPNLDLFVRVTRDGTHTRATIPLEDVDGDLITIEARPRNLVFSIFVQECVAEADAVFLTVETPGSRASVGSGETDLAAFTRAIHSVATNARPGTIIVEKSTVPVKTADTIEAVLESVRPGVHFDVLSNPEFLSEGTAIDNILMPDRILIGSRQTPSGILAEGALKDVYTSWVERSKILSVDIYSSELAKLAANAMLAQRISSINSISQICALAGVNFHEVAMAVGLDHRLGPHYLQAGIGFGGPCLEKDISSLVSLANSSDLPLVAEYWKQVLEMNHSQCGFLIEDILPRLGGTLREKKIGVLGYAFKENTSDTRGSIAARIIRLLLDNGAAKIAIFDPGCDPQDISRDLSRYLGKAPASSTSQRGSFSVATDIYEACKDSEAVIVLTDRDYFLNTFESGKGGTVSMTLETSRDDPRVTLLSSLRSEPRCPPNCERCRKEAEVRMNPQKPIDWIRINEGMKGAQLIIQASAAFGPTDSRSRIRILPRTQNE